SGDLILIFRNIALSGDLTAASFGPAVVLNVPGLQPWGQGLAIADFDGDGRPDIVVAGGPGGISVLRNLSLPGVIDSNSFAPPVGFLTNLSAYGISTADLDNDGKVDIAASAQGGFILLRNVGSGPGVNSGTFSDPVMLTNI